jgi:hypothetical protein
MTIIRDLPFSRQDAAYDDGPLPDVLTFTDGTPVRSADDWARRRTEIADIIIQKEYGGMPPALSPEATEIELVHGAANASLRFGIEGVKQNIYYVMVSGGAIPLRFTLTVWTPPGDGPFPVILNGDGCWPYLTDKTASEALRRGWIVAAFNRCELARDRNGTRDRGIYEAFPGEYGALSAWAWGYHRAYDALLRIPSVDSRRVAITGHSRGGKTVEVAGATDTRIAAVGDNNSGCCGFGCHRVRGEGCERIADITRAFPFWFDKDFGQWSGREAELPFDQHFLASLIAPRPLLFAVAYGDTWANPIGACETYRATLPVYELLGAADNFGIVYREGGHGHLTGDWARFLDFAGERLV